MSRQDRLAELLVRWEEAAEQARPLSPEDLCRDNPELLPDFRRLLSRLGPVNALLAGAGLGHGSSILLGAPPRGRRSAGYPPHHEFMTR